LSDVGERELLAIIFTDAVDSTARTASDEDYSLRILLADLDSMRNEAAVRGGTVLKNTGDGLLISFKSAVDAVECALSIQRGFADRAENAAFKHKIGVHIGDVIKKDGDIYGSGVNTASRLVAQCPAGGLCMSSTLYELVRQKSQIGSLKLQDFQLANIEPPLKAYRLEALPDRDAPSSGNFQPAKAPRGQGRNAKMVAGLAGAILLLGGAIWWQGQRNLTLGGLQAQAPAAESSFEGDWVGRLSDKMGNLKLVFHIQRQPSGFTATMDSPSQGGYGIPVSQISLEGEQVSLRIDRLDLTYQGKFDSKQGEIRGTFFQGGMVSELVLRPLAALTARMPKEIAFTYGAKVPKDFRPISGEGLLRIQLRNETADYICLATLNAQGNLLHGWADGRPGSPVFYVGPGSRTDPAAPYRYSTGSTFVVLTAGGRILGYARVQQAGECELVIE